VQLAASSTLAALCVSVRAFLPASQPAYHSIHLEHTSMTSLACCSCQHLLQQQQPATANPSAVHSHQRAIHHSSHAYVVTPVQAVQTVTQHPALAVRACMKLKPNDVNFIQIPFHLQQKNNVVM